jgi:orotate phosphoribosyltransferase
MKDYQEKFIRLALEAEALNFGDFTLKSGRKSPYFFNAAKMLNTKFLMSLSECYTKTIEDLNVTFDSIYGPAYKGIFLASIIGSNLGRSKLDIPISFNRKEEKEHGEGGDIIGQLPSGNVLIVDDVISAGTAARESIVKIKSIGANPKIMLVGLDRQEKGSSDISAKAELENDFGLTVSSIVDLDLLISFVSDESNFKEFKGDLEEYRNNWGA